MPTSQPLTAAQRDALSRIGVNWTEVTGIRPKSLLTLKDFGLIEYRVLSGCHHRARRVEGVGA